MATTTATTTQQAIDLLNEAGTAYRILPNGTFLIDGGVTADHDVVKLWGAPVVSIPAPRTETVWVDYYPSDDYSFGDSTSDSLYEN